MENIIPWLIISSSIAFVVSVSLTAKYWRDSKRSPYFFLRRQAEQNMQTFSFYSIICAVLILFLVTYARQPVKDNTLRMVYLDSAKPDALVETSPTENAASTASEPADSPEIVILSGQNFTEITTDLIVQQAALSEGASLNAAGSEALDFAVVEAERAPTLPLEYNQFEPSAELAAEATISPIAFSTEIDEFDLIALDPERVFGEGSFTIYATFDYEGLEDGLVWSWVWRRDGQVVNGGNEVWVYGDEGPGYVFYNPREGFQEGEYTLEIWVNEEMMKSANLFITSDIAASR